MTTAATYVTGLGCAVMTGLFFAFSVSVMPGLRQLPMPPAIGAMQSFNAAILNPVFGVVFGVASVGSAYLVAVSLVQSGEPGTGWRLAGGLLFVAGGFVITAAVNVPLNNALDGIDPHSTEGALLWQRYVVTWTRWNHARTLASLGVTAALIWALRG